MTVSLPTTLVISAAMSLGVPSAPAASPVASPEPSRAATSPAALDQASPLASPQPDPASPEAPEVRTPEARVQSTALTVAGGGTFTAGQQVTLTAVQSPEAYPPHYHWFKKAPGAAKFTTFGGESGGSLSFTMTAADDGAEFYAALYNDEHEKVAASNPVRVTLSATSPGSTDAPRPPAETGDGTQPGTVNPPAGAVAGTNPPVDPPAGPAEGAAAAQAGASAQSPAASGGTGGAPAGQSVDHAGHDHAEHDHAWHSTTGGASPKTSAASGSAVSSGQGSDPGNAGLLWPLAGVGAAAAATGAGIVVHRRRGRS